MHFCVVVEVNENVFRFFIDRAIANQFRVARLSAAPPQVDPICPPIDRAIVVAAHVKFLRAVEADVNEIGGEIFGVGEFPGGVGNYEGNVFLPEQVEKIRRHKTRMPNFDRVPDRPCDVDLRKGAGFQFVVVFFREVCGRLRVARQQIEKRIQTAGVETEIGRQLPENWSKLFAQSEHARRKEVRERDLDAAELFHVGDESTAFDREKKIRRRRIAPPLVTRRKLERVKRTVDLDRVESFPGKFELAMLRQIFRIKFCAPTGVTPA